MKITVSVTSLVIFLFSQGAAQASSCNPRQAFILDPDAHAREEAICARDSLTKSKTEFAIAISAKERGEFTSMCNALGSALNALEPYKKGNWRKNDAYEEIADKVDSNYSTILDSLIATKCPEKLTLYKKKAAEGASWAIRNLGVLHRDGELVAQNYTEAMRYFKEAADKGNTDALVNIGGLYEEGKGVPKSDSEAFIWYMKAAKEEDSTGEYNVGYFYLKGRGVVQNFEEAAKWFRLAKEHGEEDAEARLQEMYKAGQAKKPFLGFW